MVNIGAVFTPIGDFGTKLGLLQLMNADTVRVSQNFNDQGPIFGPDQLQQIVDSVSTEVIIQSSEHPTEQEAVAQLNSALQIIRANLGKYFVFEIGNEPDQGYYSGDPGGAGQAYVQAYRACKGNAGDHADGRVPNLWYAINQPSNNATADYWNAFNAQGVGEAEYATVHIYPPPSSPLVMCDHPEWGNDNPWKIYDFVRGYYGTGKPVKVTEAGMERRQGWDPYGNYGSVRGFDYLEFANRIAATGNTDSVCFYGLPDVAANESYLSLDINDMNQLATRQPSGYCG